MQLFGVVPLPEDLKFPALALDYPLAIVTLANAHGNKVRSKVFVVTGKVFCITSDKSPLSLGQEFKVTEARLINDPSQGMLAEAPPEDLFLPADYSELQSSDDTILNGWAILPPNEIREVVQQKDNLYIFAEKENVGMICVRAGDETARPFFVNFDNSEEVEMKGSLLEIFRAK